MTFLHHLYDKRTECYSILISMPVNEYLKFIKAPYENQGNLDGQRSPLVTTTGKRVRNRMINDLKEGAIVPPIVIGAIIEKEPFEKLKKLLDKDASNSFKESLIELQKQLRALNNDDNSLSIIDGMQRTTAYIEAGKAVESNEIRVEIWLAQKIESLTYRMLVLNTGQTPWNLRRQLEVLFKPLINSIETRLKEDFPDIVEKWSFSEIDSGESRTNPGIYQKRHIIEAYIAFSLRKEKVSNQTVLADEFSRLDMVDSQTNSNFIQIFNNALAKLILLDHSFSNCNLELSYENEKYKNGKNIFDGQPARIGFFTAFSLEVFGSPGIYLSDLKIKMNLERINDRCDALISSTNSSKDGDEFLKLDILNEKYKQMPTNKVGDSQREFFKEAFRQFFKDNYDIDSMEPIWRS